jgi:ABC-type sugar transport system substrate-binding protein
LGAALLSSCGDDDDNDSASNGGSAPGASSEDKPVKIAFFNILKANTFSAANLEGIKKVADAEGATVEEFDAALDIKKQIAQIQDAAASGEYDAFLAIPVGPAIRPALQEAAGEGIKVGTALFSAVEPAGNKPLPGGTISVNQAISQRGTAIADLIIGACGDTSPCRVAYIWGVPALPLEQAQLNASKARLKGHPNIELTAVQPANAYDRAAGRKTAQDLLQADPDLDVIASVGDQLARGAEDAVAARNLDGKVQITGMGASRPAKEAVLAGRWYGSIVTLPITEGEVAVKALIDAVRGSYDGPPAPNIIEESPIGPLMIKDNAAEFTPQWDG